MAMTDIFGDVGANPVYAGAFCRALERVWQEGSRAVLARYVDAFAASA